MVGVTLAATVILAAALTLAVEGDVATRRAAPATGATSTLSAMAPEAGLIAIAGPVPGTVRVLYARNGGMVLLREISVPAGGNLRELSLSADGSDLFIATDLIAYAISTRTGRIEAQAPASAAGRVGSTVAPDHAPLT